VLITLTVFIFPLGPKDENGNRTNTFQIGNSRFDFHSVASTIRLGLDLEGGVYAVFSANLDEFDGDLAAQRRAMEGTVSNLQQLLFSRGYSEAVVTRQGANLIRVEVPALGDTEQLIELIGEPADLQFRNEDGDTLIWGTRHLDSAEAVFQNGAYAVSLSFNREGREAFARATADNVGKRLSIFINDELVISPNVQGAITDGNAIITGNYTFEQANDLAVKISAGTFDVILTVDEARTISATLGADALRFGIIAGIVGLIAIIIIMFVAYRGMGLAASLALLIYVVLLIYLIALFGIQLSLPGIAGIILSIGMATDANVIIFERIKDERWNTGKSIRSSVKFGFKRAISTIFDANITTIMGALVMFLLGSTAIQSFALTLLVGIILSMFTAILVTRLLVYISLSFNDESAAWYGLGIRDEDIALSRASKRGA
jgi:protein-export SecD/SecF family membrane protein